MKRQELYLPPQDFSDAYALFDWIISSDMKRSAAIDILYNRMRQNHNNLPCAPIDSVNALEQFLSDKCQYRYYTESSYGRGIRFSSHEGVLNFNNKHSSDQAVFVVIHPASGIRSSNGGDPFVSMTHHNFTLYSGQIGPMLVVDDPWSRDMRRPTFSFFGRKKAIPLEVVMQFDDNPNIFWDRNGTEGVTVLGTQHDSIVFVDTVTNPHEGPEASNRERFCVFVPLQKDEETIEHGWVVYGVEAVPSDG